MTEMFCSYPNREETLIGFVYDDLPSMEKTSFAAHLATCETCRSEIAAFGGVRHQLASWSPPALTRSLSGAQASPAPPARRWLDMPAWMQVAAAVLVLGVSAGAANLRIEIGSQGMSVRTGWMAPAAPVAAATATQADLAKLQQEVRAELARVSAPPILTPVQSAPFDENAVRRVRAMITESEQRQQLNLAFRINDVYQEALLRRQADINEFYQHVNDTVVPLAANQRQIYQTLNRQLARPVSDTR